MLARFWLDLAGNNELQKNSIDKQMTGSRIVNIKSDSFLLNFQLRDYLPSIFVKYEFVAGLYIISVLFGKTGVKGWSDFCVNEFLHLNKYLAVVRRLSN